MMKPIMGIQLYTLRDHIKNAEDFDKTLGILQGMGVTDVQISGIGDIPAQTQKEILDKHNMKVCVTHKSFDWYKNNTEEAIEHHKIIGCDALGIGGAPDFARSNRPGLRDFIAQSAELAKKFKAAGMTFNYHNHSFEFQKLNDVNCSIMDILLEETDPELFKFIPDVAWIHYADKNPVDVLRQMQGRVKVLHFKDYIINADKERHFCSLGKGIVNLKECYEAACELEIPYIMYEQDIDWVNNDAFEATKESWEYMMKL